MNTRGLMIGTVLLAGFTAVMTAQNAGPDWPQWRGPRRRHAHGVHRAERPGPTLNQRWKITVGEGYSVIWQIVYQFATAENEILRAIDAATGE